MSAVARLTQLIGVLILRPWLNVAFRVRVRRQGPRPDGAVLYAANHRSFADPPLVAVWSAVPCAFFARASLWKLPVVRQFLDIFGGIPVERDNAGAASMKGAIRRLQDGWPVVIFPEGTRTRSGSLGRLREGPALFARRAGVAIVPVYVHRSEAIWPRGWFVPALWGARVEVRFGKPLRPPAQVSTKEADQWVTRQLELWMLRQERALRGPHSARVYKAGQGS